MMSTLTVSQLDLSCPTPDPHLSQPCAHYLLLYSEFCKHCPAQGLPPTSAAFHQYDVTLVAKETLALEAARGVDTGTLAAEVEGDVALADVWEERVWARPPHLHRHRATQEEPHAAKPKSVGESGSQDCTPGRGQEFQPSQEAPEGYLYQTLVFQSRSLRARERGNLCCVT